MCAMRSKIFLIAFALLVAGASCARILGLFPHVGKSHSMVFQPLLRKLAERGHHVTTVSFFPMPNPPANYTDVSLGSTNLAVGAINISIFENRSLLMKVPVLNTLLHTIFEVNRIRYLALIHCEKILTRHSLGEVLRREYDVVLMENFNSDCMLGLLYVHKNNAPIVGLSSCGVMPWSPERFGLPDNPAYVPIRTTSFTDTMSFQQRLENTIVNVYLKYWYHQLQEKERTMIEKHYRVKIPHLAELAKKHTKLLLHNTFHSLNLVRPMLPASVEVGGMHLHRKMKIVPPVCYY